MPLTAEQQAAKAAKATATDAEWGDAGELPEVSLGLTYTAQEDERPTIRWAGIPAWVLLVGGVGFLAWKFGDRIGRR